MVALLVASAVLALPRASRAQAAPEAPVDAAAEAARERAQPHFARGLEMVARQQWHDALEAFLLARREYDSPILAFNIGYCQRALGESVAALATLRGFLARELSGVAATRRAQAEDLVRELEARVARVTIAAPDVARAGGEVTLDGRTLALDARGAGSAAIDPGHHVIAARAEGYRPFYADRDVAPGAAERVVVALRPMPARLLLRSNVRGASARVDGVSIGRAPLAATVEPGPRRLEVFAPGFVPHRSTVNFTRGASTRLTIELAREPVTRQWWFWSIVGGAVAGVAVAVSVGTYYATVRPEYDPGNLGILVQAP